jgi:hypothetical protein
MIKYDWIKKHNNQILGLFILLFSLWIILYIVPEFLILLFHTLLGNVLLIVFSLLLFAYNKSYGVLFFVSSIVLYRVSKMESKENFTDKPQEDFIKLQHSINPNSIFDMQVLSRQVSQEDIDYYNKNGIWYWTPEVQQLYENAVIENPFIRTFSGDSRINAQKIYNQNAILRLLGQQTKEGTFLLSGVLLPMKKPDLPDGYGDFPYSSGLKQQDMDIIKCNMKNDIAYPEKTHYTGKRGIFGEKITTTEVVNNVDLPKLIPGFSFLKEPCNPCNAINAIPNYDCSFLLKTAPTDNSVSPVWQFLWS